MASAKEDETFASFELCDDLFLSNETVTFENLTQEELEAVQKALDKIESDNSVETPQQLTQHKVVDNDELDRLAGNNNAKSTGHQTKRAVSVLNGENIALFPCILMLKYYKT